MAALGAPQGPVTIDTIVVTSSRGEEALRDVTTNMTIIGEEIITSSGAVTLYDLLDEMGFYTSTNFGGSGAIQMRGFNSDEHGNDLGGHVLLLIDGRRILTGNLAMVGLANIERIEIIRGPSSAQYGSSAMGGVINMITKKGTNLPFSATLEAGGGTSDSFRSLAKLSGSSGQFDFALGASYSKMGDFSDGDGLLFHNTYYKNYGVNLTAGYTFNDTHRVGVTLNYFEYPKAGMPWSTASPGENYLNKANYLIGLDYDGANEDGSLSWLARLGYGKDSRDYFYPANTAGDSFYDYTSKSAQAQLTWKLPVATITAGMDYLKYDLEASGDANAARQGDYADLGAFLLAKLRFLDDKLVFSAAGRFDKFDLEVADLGISRNKTHFAPSVGLAYIPVHWLKFRANFANSFSIPTSDQLGANYIYTGYYGYTVVGNPDLKPEETDTWEFGVDVSNQYASASATYFHSKTENLIGSDNDYVNSIYSWQNYHLGYRSGVELSVSADLAGMAGQNFELRPYFNLTHMFKYTGKINPEDDFEDIPEIPENVYGFGVRVSQADIGLTANVSVNKIGSMVIDAATTHASGAIVNLAVTKRLFRTGDKGEVYAKLTVDNFTNALYLPDPTYPNTSPLPGRIVYMGLGYSY